MKKIFTIFILSVFITSSLHALNCEQTQKVQAFAERFYTVVLERPAENTGLDYWTNNLTSGTLTGADVANGFVFSTEYLNKHTSNQSFLTTLYHAFFNRKPDVVGLNGWMTQLNSGIDRKEILYGFLYSQEFINLSNSYGIKAYEGAAFNSSSLTSFVERFYTVVLGRDSDKNGLKEWTNRLSTQVATGSDIAVGFIFSSEYNETSKSNSEYLTTLYRAFFDREPDAGGFNSWMKLLNSGTSRAEVLQGFLHAPEFIHLTNSFGILAFEGAPISPSDNIAPVANAGADQSINFGNLVTLNASQSHDSDGTIVCTWWSESEILLGMDTSIIKSDFTVGIHNIRLTVVDNSGVSNSNTIKITTILGEDYNYTKQVDFPFGFYGNSAERSNFSPQIYIESTMDSKDIEYVFKDAKEGGYKVYQYISADVLYHPLEVIRDEWINPAIAFGEKHGDSLAGFYIAEEMGVDAAPRIKTLRNLIHELAPTKPAITYLGYYEDWTFEDNPDLGRSVDANVIGTYPIYKKQSMGLMTGVMALGRKYNQSLGTKLYSAPSTWDAILALPDASLRVRSMLMQGLIGGAEGIEFFNNEGFIPQSYPTLNTNLDQMQDEFTGRGRLAEVLMQPKVGQVVTATITDGPTNPILFDNYFTTIRSFERIQMVLKAKGDDLYLFVANIGGYDEDNTGKYSGSRTPNSNSATNGTLTVEFANLPTEASNIVALSESSTQDAVGNRIKADVGTNRSISMHNGTFTDTLGPYETHVYKVAGNLPAGFVLDMDDPTVYMSNYINQSSMTITGTVYPPSSVTVNGVTASVTGNRYTATITLTEGDNQIITVNSAYAGSRLERKVSVDFTTPETTSLQKISTGDVFPLKFTWEGNDTLSGTDFYSYRIDSGEWSIWQSEPSIYFDKNWWTTHHYSFGEHTLEVRTRDRAFNIDASPATLTFTASPNEAPSSPTISGTQNGIVGGTYPITVQSIDPEGDAVSFNVVWDDGTQSGWTGFVPSGENLDVSHTFNFGGEHIVRVLVKDTAGNVTRWTDTHFYRIAIAGSPTKPFPYGFYGLEREQDRTQYSHRVYIDSAMQPNDIDYVIGNAADHGLQVYQYLSQSVVPLTPHVLAERWIVPAMTKGDTTGALAGYYPAEEFSLNAIPRYMSLMNTVHETDPKHRPVVTYIGAYSNWEFDQEADLVNTVDINIMGAYPIFKEESMALMTGIMEIGHQYFHVAGKKIYAAAETYGAAMTLPDARLRIRNTTYQAAIGGAVGFINYTGTGYDNDKYPDLNIEYDMLAEELVGTGKLGEVLLQGDPIQVIEANITSGPTNKILFENYFTTVRSFDRIQTRMEIYQGDLYLFVANIGGYDEDNNGVYSGSRTPDSDSTSNGTVTVKFTHFPDIDESTLVALSESSSTDAVGNRVRMPVGTNREIHMNSGTFSDTFGPYEVHIYRVKLR